MERDGITKAAYVLALVLAVGYLVGGIGGWIGDVTDGDGSDLAVWLVLLIGGALMLLAGIFGVRRWSAASVALIGVGAVAGALPLFWTIIVPVLALVLIGLAVAATRRARPAGV